MAFDDGPIRELKLDIEKLHALPSEQQELYLLTFVNELVRHVSGLDNEEASARQAHIKTEVFKILTLASPAPTRVIRNNLGQALAGILGKGDRKLLYETINELLAVVNSGKGEKDVKSKHAATHCLGMVYEAAGDSAISLAPMTCSSVLRLLKSTANYTGFRGAIFRALGRIVKGIAHSTDETLAREMWKQARQAASGDKSLLVQANACWCLERLYLQTSYFDNASDFEKLQGTMWKVLDSASPVVRRAAAYCMSAVLVKSYNPNPSHGSSSWKKKTKTSKKKQADGDDDVEASKGTPVLSPTMSNSISRISFGLAELLGQLSYQYCRSSTSNKARAGIALCYARTFKGLGDQVVEKQYEIIARHFLEEILSSQTISNHRYRLLISRKFVGIILGDVIGRKQLGEAGQISATKFLVNSILKDYPEPATGRSVPSKHTLIGAITILTSLIQCLGSATAGIAELCRDGIIQVLEHPSYTVQVLASRCLQALAMACPQQVLPTVTICMNSVNRQLGLLSGARRSPKRCLAFAFGLSAVIRVSSSQPLSGSIEVYSRILTQATSLLKSSGSSDLRISRTQIQVAWTMISGLMSLGPNFVKIHLSQLLLLWRNALPKPLPKENIANQGVLELSFLAHVRECALGSIRAFLAFNARLLTMDVYSRLSGMLQNTVMFLNVLPRKNRTEDTERLLSQNLQLQDYDQMVRRRVFECYSQLASLGSQENNEMLLQSDVLSMAATAFADPDTNSASSITSSIASQSGAFDSIWEVGDNSGFGINGLVHGFELPRRTDQGNQKQRHWLSRRGIEADLDRIVSSPTCDALEHDAFLLYGVQSLERSASSDPLGTEVVNAAIKVWATLLPLQSPKVQAGSLEQLSSLMDDNAQQKNSIRESAVKLNVTVAILFALQHALEFSASLSGGLKSSAIEKTIQDILHPMIIFPDPYLRYLAAEALGCLCKSSGNEFASKEVNYLIDVIVANREPHVRSGCAVALGCIHSELGGMAAGLHLQTIFGLLASLANDAHPTVHFWALDSLSKVADAAGLTFSTFVPNTLGMLAQLYVQETHNEDAGPLGSSNLEVDHSAVTVIARCVDSVVNVLGPDLQDATKTRNLIMTMAQQFQSEPQPLVAVTTLQSLEHLSLYAPGHISFVPYVRHLQASIGSEDADIQMTAMNALHNAMRRNADEVFRSANPNLEEQLWSILNDVYGEGILYDLMKSWVQQTALLNIDAWTKRCHTILTKQVDPQKGGAQPEVGAKDDVEPNLQDEEVAGFAASSGTKEDPTPAPESTSEFLRWQVRSVAMDCLNDILSMVVKEIDTQDESPAAAALQPRIADLIRIAFTASTASVVELRIQGIQIIRQVLLIFGKTPDPDFMEVPLLEQYQAQISSALTPAFAADSSPILAAESVGVCAAFIATGIVTTADRMGRILKLLVSALDDFSKDTEVASIGDLKGLSSNAQVMVRLAIFSAWAELQIASLDQKYLVEVVKPHLRQLTPLWLESLKEYARLKFEPDISATAASSTLVGGGDMLYGALSRETLLKFYQDTWLNIINALASLIDEDSEFVFNALEEKQISQQTNGDSTAGYDINYRNEPAAFFFVLFGIAFEALVSSSNSDSTKLQVRMVRILQAMKKILRPSIAGLAIYQEAVFSEAMDLLDRLVLTEGLEVQIVIVEIARNLCIEHPSARSSQQSGQTDGALSDDIDQLFELTRIIVLVIARLVPTLSENSPYAQRQLTEDMIPLVILALTALADAAEAFPSIIKGDLHACILHIFATILSTGNCQESIVPQSLPIFRRFITSLASSTLHHDTTTQIRNLLARFLVILKNAQKRESEAALPCEKNTLLASTILLTSVPRIFPAQDPLVMRFLDEVIDTLNNSMTSKTSANCARSLLLLQGSTASATEAGIVAHMLPRLIDFLTNPSDIEGTELTRPVISQALITFAVNLAPKTRPAAISLLVPALLQRAAMEGKSVWKETSARLLELVNADQAAFRGVMALMEGDQRTSIEEILRAGGAGDRAGRDKGEDRETAEPSIALRMDF